MFPLRGIGFPERWYYLFGREQDFSCFNQNALLAGMLCFLYPTTLCLGAFGLMLINIPYASQLSLLECHQSVLYRSGSQEIQYQSLGSKLLCLISPRFGICFTIFIFEILFKVFLAHQVTRSLRVGFTVACRTWPTLAFFSTYRTLRDNDHDPPHLIPRILYYVCSI